MVEIWKDIKGYEGLYQVSNLGRVKSLERIITKKNGVTLPIKEKILQYGIDRKGYYFVGLYKNSKGKNKSIARLVAEAFIPNPDNKPEINHINTIRTDNRVWVNEDGSIEYDKSNLEWCTHKENCNNPLTKEHQKIAQTGKRLSEETKKKISDNNKGRKCYWEGKISKEHPNSKPIIQFSLNGDLIKKWECFNDVKRELGIHHSNIIKVINGARNQTGNSKWEYYDTDRYLIALMNKTLKDRGIILRKGVA